MPLFFCFAAYSDFKLNYVSRDGLGHKSWYYTVEGETIVKTFAGQLFDAKHMARCNI